MQDEIREIRGYVDPRTGQYVRTREDADPNEVAEALAFIAACMLYWDGPVGPDKQPIFSREEWLESETRLAWLEALTEEQRKMLADSYPPEEVPALADG